MWSALSTALLLAPTALAHAAFWDPSMFGFNVTAQTFPYDNRPVVPLAGMTFDQWWLHNHIAYPPNAGDIFDLPAGGVAVSQIACNKGATKWWASSEGTTDIRQGDYPCPNSPLSAFHTTGFDDLKGCALAIAYNSDVNSVGPEDFVIFSVNHTCVWTVTTDFQVPSAMPACPAGGCLCTWNWIHSVNSGSEQIYMNAFRCAVSGPSSTVPLAAGRVARRCGAEPEIGKAEVLSNCTLGAKQPLYWYQQEGNTLFEDQYAPPYYNELYHFLDGAQNDIFLDSDISGGYYPSPSAAPSYVAAPAPAQVFSSPAVLVELPVTTTPVATPISDTPISDTSCLPSPSRRPQSATEKRNQKAIARHYKRRSPGHSFQ